VSPYTKETSKVSPYTKETSKVSPYTKETSKVSPYTKETCKVSPCTKETCKVPVLSVSSQLICTESFQVSDVRKYVWRILMVLSVSSHLIYTYGVASVRRIDKIIGLF